MQNISSYEVADFQREVIESSVHIPVVADFWAEWCGPCKMLTPVLERLASSNGGKWVLAKVNTEEHPDAATEFGVQSIPNVKLFSQGKVVAEFVGALPEYAIVQWLKENLPSPGSAIIQQAIGLMRDGEMSEAQSLLEQVLMDEPENLQVKALLAKATIFSNPERAAKLVEGIDDPRLDEITESVRTFLRAFDANTHPENFSKSVVKERYRSAIGEVRKLHFDPALEILIGIIRDDRYYDDDGARKLCIAIFRYLGEEHPTTIRHRREFGNALYV